MGKFAIAAIWIFIFGAYSFAQTDKSSPCPVIDMAGPAGPIQPGSAAVFTVSAGFDENLVYIWSVSGGIITSGQGSPVVSVATSSDIAGTKLIATVEIQGLPAGCPNRYSEVASVKSKCEGTPITLDSYGRLSFEDEKKRLDDVVSKFRKMGVPVTLFLIYRYTKKDDLDKLRTRMANVTQYLVEKHKVPKEKITNISSENTDVYETIIYPGPDICSNDQTNELQPSPAATLRSPMSEENSTCPTIEIFGPSGLVATGKKAIYTVRVMKADQQTTEYDDSGLEYVWSASDGKIISGQGTRTITIEQPQSALTATVEVKGLPANCSNFASESSFGDLKPQAVLISEFWTTTTTDEAELEKLAAELRKDPSAVCYIFIGTTGNEGKEIYERKRDELTSWIERSDIPREMFTLVDLPDTENITQIWIVPTGADLPIPQKSKLTSMLRACPEF